MQESDELPYQDVVKMKCPTSVKTLEMFPVGKQKSISKMLIKPSNKSANPKVIIDTELLKSVVLAASTASNSDRKSSLDKVMLPVIERSESVELGIDTSNINSETTELLRESIDKDGESVMAPTEKNQDLNDGISAEKFSHVELEPVRRSVYAVRQRNRQFFNSVTEEPSDIDSIQSSNESKLRKVPIFTRGRSLQNLYVKDTEPQSTDAEEDINLENKETTLQQSSLNLLSKVKAYKPLRRINSSPELKMHHSENDENNQGLTSLSTSDSLDHLKRKMSLSHGSVNTQSSPGYAFLASVVESLRGRQTKAMALRADMTVAKINSKLPTDTNGLKTLENENFCKKAAEPIEKASAPINVDMIEEKPKISFMRSVYEWGTTSKQGVSNKEMNMYSPVSF